MNFIESLIPRTSTTFDHIKHDTPQVQQPNTLPILTFPIFDTKTAKYFEPPTRSFNTP
ncbi:hypothetical protein BofuT4_uP080500.1 [Botrytis cinerea T4]|uniref:Uncharacterized protein n=1 Tax=Botryotinia fuckeliana (strain T4) TaxID=999810 RepID=G2YKV7_BOTF4|nr:hypothetical protein BofuT4_uP080500.1 [Botrytis cinerea T4]